MFDAGENFLCEFDHPNFNIFLMDCIANAIKFVVYIQVPFVQTTRTTEF